MLASYQIEMYNFRDVDLGTLRCLTTHTDATACIQHCHQFGYPRRRCRPFHTRRRHRGTARYTTAKTTARPALHWQHPPFAHFHVLFDREPVGAIVESKRQRNGQSFSGRATVHHLEITIQVDNVRAASHPGKTARPQRPATGDCFVWRHRWSWRRS